MSEGGTAALRYVGRFAPSPTGPLHAGSLVAALASWLDARAWRGGLSHSPEYASQPSPLSPPGRWLVRIEDVDTPRCVPGAAPWILQQLADCGLVPDEPPAWQSTRTALYQHALDQLIAAGHAYPCACSRKDIEDAHAAQSHARERHTELPYPGTCRNGLHGRTGRSWRFNVEKFIQKQPLALTKKAQVAINSRANYSPRRTTSNVLTWHDRRLGLQQQDVSRTVGDFVLRRADGLWAYQLAVVVDDAAQGITHIVRGEDLADNTPRQVLLQRALGLPMPHYLHTPLVRGDDGDKLSKQNGAQALDTATPHAAHSALNAAARALGLLPVHGTPDIPYALAQWVAQWRALHPLP